VRRFETMPLACKSGGGLMSTRSKTEEPPTKTQAPSRRQVPCECCPLRTKKVFRAFTAEELAFVKTFKTGELTVEAGSMLFLEGTSSAHLYTVLTGVAFRYKLMQDGRRQILNYCFPGDFIGLQGSVMQEMQHSIEALSDIVLCVFQREGLWRLFESHAGLSFDVTWLAAPLRADPRSAAAFNRPAQRYRAMRAPSVASCAAPRGGRAHAR
jgi:CRP-like cAMP-binding protein